MTTTTTTTFVPAAEAAFIAGLTDRQIQRAMDEDIIIAPLVKNEDGRRFTKLASALAKFYYAFESTLTAGARKQVIEILTVRLKDRSDWSEMLALDRPTSAADWTISLADLTIDLDQTIKSVKERIAQLDVANRQIVQDPEILSGAPVFKGTRIPVDTVLAMKRVGADVVEVQRHYPSITEQQIEAAEIYRLVNPKRGRPPSVTSEVRPDWKQISRKHLSRKK